MGNIIYLLGAGRSGTTLLGAILNTHSKIKTIGEMHQFLDHMIEGKVCSCGKKLDECVFWEFIYNDIDVSGFNLEKINEINSQKEDHKNIVKLLLTNKPDSEYLNFQNLLYESISKQHGENLLLDSSKYIARYLLLKKSDKMSIKGIYVVRDVRGVINSFGKQVQTPKSPIKAIIYYMIINFLAEIVLLIDKNVTKVKYEDIVNDSLPTINKLYTHIFEKNFNLESIPSTVEMPHIIGGNRMKKNTIIKINSDEAWKDNIPRFKQVLYYILASPIMIINRYKI